MGHLRPLHVSSLQVEEIRTPMPDDGEPIAVMLLRPRDAGIEAAEDDVPMQRAS